MDYYLKWNQLNAQAMMKLYLYGELQIPDLTSDSVIRDPEITNPEDAYTTVYLDAASYMQSGPGRFHNAYNLNFVSDFFLDLTKKFIGTGVRQEFKLNQMVEMYHLPGTNNPNTLPIQQYLYDDGADDYVERVFMYNSTSAKLDDEAIFVIDPDGKKHIENFRLIPFDDNFDFSSDSLLAKFTNAMQEPQLDPSGIGRRVNIEFEPTSKKSIPLIDYGEANYQNDVRRYFASYDLTHVLKLWDEKDSFVQNLFSSGVVKFLDQNDRPIIYGSNDIDFLLEKHLIQAGMTDFLSIKIPLLYPYKNNGIHFIAGEDVDVLEGGEHDDVFDGGANRDLLKGGKGNDLYKWSTGDDLDTIVDSDGQGRLEINGQLLGEGKKADDGLSFSYVDASGQSHQYVVLDGNINWPNGGTLRVDAAFNIENYHAGELGLTSKLPDILPVVRDVGANALLDNAILQSVAESYLHLWIDNPYKIKYPNGETFHSLDEILAAGVNHPSINSAGDGATRLTPTQISWFKENYAIVYHYPNDASGFSATLFLNKSGEYTLSFRSTEYQLKGKGGDYERDGSAAMDGDISGRGFGLGQLSSMENFYQNLKKGMVYNPTTEQWEQSDNGLILAFKEARPELNVVGYSLGGHLATAFTLMHAEDVNQTYTYNSAGLGGYIDGDKSFSAPTAAQIKYLIGLYQQMMAWNGQGETDWFADVYLQAGSAKMDKYIKTAQLEPNSPMLTVDNIYTDSRKHNVVMDVLQAYMFPAGAGADVLNLTDGIGDFQLIDSLVKWGVSSGDGYHGHDQNTFVSKVGEVSAWNGIVQRYGHGEFFDPQFVANSGFHAPASAIWIEDLPMTRDFGAAELTPGLGLQQWFRDLVGDFGETHSITPIIDSLTVLVLLQKLSPSFNVGDNYSTIMKAVSNRIDSIGFNEFLFDADALENIVNELTNIFTGLKGTLVPDVTATGFSNPVNREAMHQAIQKIEQSDVFKKAIGAVTILPLSDFDSRHLVERALSENADGVAFRYALMNGNPFVLLGVDYSQHNVHHELELYSNQSGLGALTDEFIIDRAEWLYWKMQYDSGHRDDFERTKASDRTDVSDKQYDSVWQTNSAGDDTTFIDKAKHELTFNINFEYQSDTEQINKKIVFGNNSNDTLNGGGEQNHFYGKEGNDALSGGGGDDILDGGDGIDFLSGGAGSDRMYGGANGDVINGGDGADIIEGGSGDDDIFAGKDVDTLKGGSGYDTYHYMAGDGSDIIEDTDGQILYGNVALSGGKQLKGNNYVSADGAISYLLIPAAHAGVQDKLLIHGSLGSLMINNFHNGDLNIKLEEALPAKVPTNQVTVLSNDNLNLVVYGNTIVSYGVNHRIIGAVKGFIMEPVVFTQTKIPPYSAPVGAINTGNGNDLIQFENIDNNQGIVIHTGDGNDGVTFYEPSNLGRDAQGAFLYGEAGNDLLAGSRLNDWIEGGIGHDYLKGNSGADVLLGMEDNDLISGERDQDYILGGDGNDWLYAGAGTDFLFGGTGNDKMYGDTDVGSSVITWIGASEGMAVHPAVMYWTSPVGSILERPLSLDVVEVGDDILYGDGGDDAIFAGGGNDLVYGGQDNDQLYGEGGSDSLYGGQGNDVLNGDISLAQYDYDNTLFSSEYSEAIKVTVNTPRRKYKDSASVFGDDYLNGEEGNDTLVGNGGADKLFGGTGNDYLDGDSDDAAIADHGDDYLDGGDGDDTLVGHGGADILFGGEGKDQLYGGAGDDTLIASVGADSLYGGEGDDVYVINRGDGVLHIVDDIGQNHLRFGSGFSADDMKLVIGSLALDFGNGDVIHIENFDSQNVLNNPSIALFEFADGTVYSTGQLLQQGFDIDGSMSSDSLNGTNVADHIYGYEGNDVIQGGMGNDALDGGVGDDEYQFSFGDGHDTITDYDVIVGNVDILKLDGVKPEDVVLERVENDLIVTIPSAGDEIVVHKWFLPSKAYRIEKIVFSGSDQLWDEQAIEKLIVNHVPMITNPIADQLAKAENFFFFPLLDNQFLDRDQGDNLIYSIKLSDGGPLPAWLSYDASRKLLFGVPKKEDAGVVSVQVVASDKSGASASDVFNLEVLANHAPVVTTPVSDQMIAVGNIFSLSLLANQFTDPDQGDSLTYSIKLSNGGPLPAWLHYDSVKQQLFGKPDLSDAGKIAIQVTAFDQSGASATDDFDLAVNGMVLMLSVSGGSSANEGESYICNINGSGDANEALTYTINWGDGSAVQTLTAAQLAAVSGNLTHIFTDDEDGVVNSTNRTISVSVADGNAGSVTQHKVVTVNNVVPQINMSGAASVTADDIYHIMLGAVIDPGSDTVSNYLINWGDGSSDSYTLAGDKTHIYTNPGSYNVAVGLIDDDGNYNDVASQQVQVKKAVAMLGMEAVGDATVNEGSIFARTINFVDGEDDGPSGWQYSVNYGDGSAVETGVTLSKSLNLSHVYADGNASRTVIVAISDSPSENVTDSFVVSVNNVAPMIAVTGNNNVIVGQNYDLSLHNLFDPGIDILSNIQVNWGDGHISSYNSLGNVTHAYGAVGEYQISITVSDEDGTYANVSDMKLNVLETHRSVLIGDAPERLSGTGLQWQTAWTGSEISIVHKADVTSKTEQWSAASFVGANAHLLSGIDIYKGDLGVSGQAGTTSSIRQEIDGAEGLRFNLAQPADEITIYLSRLFSQDDSTQYAEAGIMRLFNSENQLLQELSFHADNLSGLKTLHIESENNISSIELYAGVLRENEFIFGGYAQSDGSYGSVIITDATGVKHGSDFMVDKLEFKLPILNVPVVYEVI